ncbi:MAG: hypothetical protein HOP15_02775 [Planctomycetes bacterium]|nr:hypothetical protein [Planctomycetota bacterium]
MPSILVLSGLAIFAVALLTAVLTGQSTVVHQDEDYRVSSAVESVAALAADGLWSRYLAEQGGAAGDIHSFRLHLSAQGIADDGAGGLPEATAGKDLLDELGLPVRDGRTHFNEVDLDAVRIVRRDVGDATQIFLTVSVGTARAEGLVHPALERAGQHVQQVYTVEPADFRGFEYALLANNLDCIFCHTRVDNAERWWNPSSDLTGSFARVKVGALESLIVRHDDDGLTGLINDHDADSTIAGSLYVRGLAAESDGGLVSWDSVSLKAHPFDETGHIVEDSSGLGLAPFEPAGNPPAPLESLYLGYESAHADPVDGTLPEHFPAPFPDDGGIDPATGKFDPGGAGNRRVDDTEFFDLARHALGAITAGVVNVTPPGEVIDTLPEYADAVLRGNQPNGLRPDGDGVQGNVVLTGTREHPIWIEGTLAIDGDLVIQGVVKGTGSIYVRANLYVPTDLVYADGHRYLPGDAPGSPSGPRTFGLADDGTKNALALAAGGNVLIGDFQRPSTGGAGAPGELEIISGGADGKWNFALAKTALFNRSEWAKTQATLPAPGGAALANPGYVQDHVPRYYGYGPNTTIPIFNQSAATWFDATTGTWQGLAAPTAWNTSQLSYARPSNPSDPFLYDPDGAPKAVISSLTHTNGWMKPSIYKQSLEYFENAREQDTPMLIDALLYTNNAILALAYRDSAFAGMLAMNGSIVAADVGLLVAGKRDLANHYPNHSSLSRYAIGLQLNYDQRLKRALSIKTPFQVQLERTYWNPRASLL